MSEPTTEQLLDFELAHEKPTGSKESQIIADLDITPGRYYQLLGRAARSEVGIAHNPIICRRIRDRRAARTRL